MRLAWLLLVGSAAGWVVGCRQSTMGVDGGARDLGGGQSSPPLLFGKLATELALDVTLGGNADGGVQSAGLKILAVWSALEALDRRSAATEWELCEVPIPGIGNVGVAALDRVVDSQATLTSLPAVTVVEQPEVDLVFGAVLEDPGSDVLPVGDTVPCGGAVTSGCTLVDAQSGLPGIVVGAVGLEPDVDLVGIDLRVRVAIAGSFGTDLMLNGGVRLVTIESHVIGCHPRGGGQCTAADVARLEAGHPTVMVTSGSFRSRYQSNYFTCPRFFADPEAALAGHEEQTDGGAPDMPRAALTFEGTIQPDLDARGCATGGCHETFVKPGQMHLVYQPATAELVMMNYQSVLPWIKGPPAGGRFVNQVPLPEVMKARWLAWVAAGAPLQ